MPGGSGSLLEQSESPIILPDAPRPPAAHALMNQSQVRLVLMVAFSVGKFMMKQDSALHLAISIPF